MVCNRLSEEGTALPLSISEDKRGKKTTKPGITAFTMINFIA